MSGRFAVFGSVLLLFAAGCGGDDGPGDSGVWPPDDAAIAAMNRGLAKLESFEYAAAAQAFREAVRRSPRWLDAKVNLAVALLNERGTAEEGGGAPGDYAALEPLLIEILAADPQEPHANFLTGILRRACADMEGALAAFERVLAVDEGDAATWYWKGATLSDLKRRDEAVAALRRAIELDPYLVAAHYSIRTPLLLLSRPEEAEAALQAVEALSPREGRIPFAGDLITLKAYTEIGRYAMAIRDYAHAEREDAPATVAFDRPEIAALAAFRYGGDGGPEFTPVERREGESDREFVLRVASRIGPGPAVGDYDADGDMDLFLPEWNGPGKLYRNDDGLKFTDATRAAGIATAAYGISAVFFDADRDGDLDLYVSAAGPNVYYENRGDGTFADRTAETGLAGGDVVSVSATPGDFDHEGDVDLFVANYARLDDPTLAGAPDALFQNNRDGTFTDVAPASGIDGGDRRSIGALALDVERDLDTDLLVIRDRQPAALWRNERVWRFTEGALPPALSGDLAAWGAAAGDVDRDGREEILVLRGPGATADLFRWDGSSGLAPVGPAALRLPIRWRSATFLDVDLDGRVDLAGDDVLLLGEDGRPAGAPAEDGSAPAAARGLAFADFDGDGDLDRAWAGPDGGGIVRTAASAENHWLAVLLVGRDNALPASWAAPTGPDQELEIRAGRIWQPLRARATSGFLSTIEQPVRFGLGGATKADFLRILWPDRVLQAEAETPADQVKRIFQTNRKPDSCPMVFAFDGTDFRFVTDFLGVGGIGFFAGPGQTGSPDPTECVRLGKWLRPVDGRYLVVIHEPLEEIAYIDEATLVAVDHPAGWDAFPEERYVGVPELFPKERIYAVAEKVFPRAATDVTGRDVLPLLLEVDRRYAPVEPDRRFPGIAAEHATTLDFTGRVPAVPEGGRLVLFLDGMTEYGYSHTVFAVSQAGIAHTPPVLEVSDCAGGWRVAIENTGFPAGLPKGMTVDVTGIVTPESPVIRLRTNLEVYWDRIFLGVDRADKVRIRRAAPAAARLHFRGYPREYSPDGRLPIIYDYALMDPTSPMKNMTGSFTKYGDVLPLVTEFDDRYVILHHGEEIRLEYAEADLPPLPEGFERTFLLFTAGWCKDMDPYTAFSDTVEPLPFRGMSGYPYPESEHYPDDEEHRRYREEWNTRRIVR